MGEKFDSLKDEATSKFNSAGKILLKLKGFFRKMFRTKRPQEKTLENYEGGKPGFNIFRPILTLFKNFCHLVHFAKGQEFFKKRIESLGGVKRNVLIRYICRELFMYFFTCFLICFVIFFVNEILVIIEKILKQGVPFKIVAKLLWYFVPNIVSQSAPFATLIGFLMCLGRMVTDNEILILRASGQRYTIVLIPVLVMGLGISLLSFVMNDYFMPLSTIKYNELMRKAISQNPAIELESNSIKRMNDKTLVIGNVDKNFCSDLIFFDISDADEQRIIVAKETNLDKASAPGVLMQMNMKDTEVLMIERNNPNNFDALTSDLMSLNVFESAIMDISSGVSPREMTSYDLKKKTDELVKKNASLHMINNYKLEYDRKFSIPFGSIFFAILAFPLSLIFGRKDGQTLGMIFGIILCVLYWVASFLTTMFGLRQGVYNFFLMWGPNILIGVVGILLYVRLKQR